MDAIATAPMTEAAGDADQRERLAALFDTHYARRIGSPAA